MKNRISILLIYIVFPACMFSQASFPYLVTDKDGYTNIRSKPNAKSKIVNKVSKNEILHIYDLGDYESYDDLENKNPVWLPLYEGVGDAEAYVYKNNVRCLYDLPEIRIEKTSEYILSFHNNDIAVSLEFEPFNLTNYTIEDPENIGFVTTINGAQALPCCHSAQYLTDSGYIMLKEISLLYKNEKYIVPEKDINRFFIYKNTLYPHPDIPERFWGIDVYGENNDAYIRISIGDGGEHYILTWIITDGIYRGIDIW